MKKLILLLILEGCAYTTVEELWQAADECGTEEHCEPLWAAYNERIEAIEERKKRNKAPCPAGYVKIKDAHREGCMKQGDMERWLKRM